MSQIFQKLKSLIMDMLNWSTSCREKTWMKPSLTQQEFPTDMEQGRQGGREGFSDISLDTGTTPRWRWFPSSFKSNSQFISRGSLCATEHAASTSSPPATPSWRNRHTNQTFYADNPKSTSNAQMEYWKNFPAP